KYLERALAVGRVLFTGEGLVLRRSDVAEVACQVHDLVIAEQQVDAPASFERLLLETHQQVHHLARIRSPIEDIPGNDQVSNAAIPGFTVQDPRVLQGPQHGRVGAVDVADGHDAIHVREAPVFRTGSQGRQ